ncbi:MAG: DUF2851 family protein [Bacteroidales bacterium]|jgi:hypothetical protein|nr:DUF2851 family protein [Bacteroidales bacterium]
MNEEFLHFIFQYKLWTNKKLLLDNGEEFEILEIGQHNFNSGPDFFNSKIKINDTIWVGNIEIHINSSDWFNHNHQNDLSYDNVILHIVFCNDKPIYYKNGNEIPTWEIQFDHALFNNYSKIQNNEQQINCEDLIKLVEPEKIKLFLEKAAIDRLEYKISEIKKILEKTNYNWEETFYICLAHSFGFNINSQPFEMMATQTPLNIIRKYDHDMYLLEALLFGQSGLFEISVPDTYFAKLAKEYQFIRQKHNLTPISGFIWKMSKTRPSNFPHVRMGQFAKIMSSFQGLFSAITDETKFKDIKKYFQIIPSNYWLSHYAFGKSASYLVTRLGKTSFDSIAINTIAPFLYIYFQTFNNEKSEELYYNWLSEIKPENNTEIRTWKNAGISPQNAYESQSLLQIKKEYCDKKNCLYCNIGYEILNKINNISTEEKIKN